MKRFWVDTIATLSFFTVVAALSELFIARMDPGDVLMTRVLMIPIMVASARPYGLWRDMVFNRLHPHGALGRVAVDTFAFLSVQFPLYAVTLAFSGATLTQIATALGSATLFMIVLGRPFGVYLDGVRALAGVAPQASPSAAAAVAIQSGIKDRPQDG